MNQDSNNNNFMDSRTLFAILLVGIVWFGWQQYINKKYGDYKNNVNAVNVVQDEKNVLNPTPENVLSEKKQDFSNKNIPVSETFLEYSNTHLKLNISSKGMALKKIDLLKYKDKESKTVHFSGGDFGIYATSLEGKILNFQITKENENTFIGIAHHNDIKVTKKISFTNGYSLNIDTDIESNQGSIPQVKVNIEDEFKNKEQGSIFSPTVDTQDIVVMGGDGEKSFHITSDMSELNEVVKQSLLTSINAHYFSAAYIDKSDIVPNFSVNYKSNSPLISGNLSYDISKDQKNVNIKAIGYIGPKDISILEKVDPLLLKVIKFGWFSAIAKPLLLIMKWFNSFVGNWGWSIILLTLLVRMIVMPLHIMSFRSMKAMQKVQPLIQSLRERYKEDPMTLNREMMALMKKHKVNPMGGCLPMLLQIPVFFALYRVFSESIELYQSPFIFWINDLSLKDPFYVLPVLMSVVMYLQQKMTPTTMDPAQAKIMQFMPLIFSLMMISLPSALTLYMFVSTLFGILQQYFFLRDKQKVEITQRA